MSEPSDVVLLVFDTVRYDALSRHGGEAKTPNIDSVAERGVEFTGAYSTGPSTGISHSSLFTGQYPSELGTTLSRKPLPDRTPTLASWLRDAGYRTFGIAGAEQMSSSLGFDRSFERYVEPYHDMEFPSTDYVKKMIIDDALRGEMFKTAVRYPFRGSDKLTALKFGAVKKFMRRSGSDPAFVMTNVPIAHRSYKSQATPALDRPRWVFLEELFGATETMYDESVRFDRIEQFQDLEEVARYLSDPDHLNDAEMGVLRGWYHASIEYLDERFGRFLSWLEESGRFEDTLVLVTADHGEFFGEHGLVTHGHCLYDEVCHVPLIASGPGLPAGETRSTLASHVDLFDTICDCLDLSAPETTTGSPLLDDVDRTAIFSEHGIYSDNLVEPTAKMKYLDDNQVERLCVRRKAARTDEHFFEVDSNSDETLARRGSETEPADDPAVRDRLYEAISETLALEFQDRESDTMGLDDDVQRNLRELGYIE